MEAVVGDDPHKATLIKQAALWLRTHGILDHLQTVAKHLAALTLRMENRIPRGPSDYPSERGIHYGGHYGGDQGPAPTREPSWQKAISGIVGSLIVLGIPAIFTVLWAMNTNQEKMNGRLSKIEEHQDGEHNLVIQRLDSIDKHLEATDKRVDATERELWPHKH